MRHRRQGFTLLELLIVVTIIGILAALLIPMAFDAIQKAKQKGTLKDINSIATALTDFVTDKGTAPSGQSGPLIGGSSIYSALNGFYIKVLPVADQWGAPFNIYCQSAAVVSYGHGITESADDEFVIVSYGRDRAAGPAFTYDPQNPATVYFEITGMVSFNQDVANWSGSWIHVPKSMQLGAST